MAALDCAIEAANDCGRACEEPPIEKGGIDVFRPALPIIDGIVNEGGGATVPLAGIDTYRGFEGAENWCVPREGIEGGGGRTAELAEIDDGGGRTGPLALLVGIVNGGGAMLLLLLELLVGGVCCTTDSFEVEEIEREESPVDSEVEGAEEGVLLLGGGAAVVAGGALGATLLAGGIVKGGGAKEELEVEAYGFEKGGPLGEGEVVVAEREMFDIGGGGREEIEDGGGKFVYIFGETI